MWHKAFIPCILKIHFFCTGIRYENFLMAEGERIWYWRNRSENERWFWEIAFWDKLAFREFDCCQSISCCIYMIAFNLTPAWLVSCLIYARSHSMHNSIWILGTKPFHFGHCRTLHLHPRPERTASICQRFRILGTCLLWILPEMLARSSSGDTF